MEAKKKMFENNQTEYIYNVANKIVEAYKNKKKTIICGNRRSASDALHFTAEAEIQKMFCT